MKSARKREPLTRAELAKTCDVTKSTIRRWEEKGIIFSSKNQRGAHVFDIDKNAAVIGDRPIIRLDQARAYLPSAADVDGEVAAKVFAELDLGRQPNQIVVDLCMAPDVVQGLFERWKSWTKAVVFTQEKLWDFVELLRISPLPRNPVELLDGTRRSLAKMKERATCRCCKKSGAKFCNRCSIEKMNRAEDRLRERFRLPPRPPPVAADPTDATDPTDANEPDDFTDDESDGDT